MEESRSTLKILTDKPVRNRRIGRPRLRWEENIKLILKNRFQHEELD